MAAETSSTWRILSGSNDWFNAAKWTNGVPNGPGHRAIIPGASAVTFMPSIASAVTVGELEFTNRFNATLSGNGILMFDQPGEVFARLIVERVGTGTLNVTMSAPIAMAGGESLVISVGESSRLFMEGPIVSSEGDIIVDNAGNGALDLLGDNSGWGGNLILDRGLVTIDNATALGSSLGTTRVNAGGALRLQNDTTITDEKLILDGGTILGWGTSFGSRYPRLNGTVELLSDSSIENVNGTGITIINGPMTGTGGVSYGLGRFQLYSDSEYQGHTYIDSDRVDVRHANALGSSAEGTTIRGASLVLIEQSVNEEFFVEGGELRVGAAVTNLGLVTLQGGILDLQGQGVFDQPVVVDGAGTNSWLRGTRTFAAGLTGVGDLTISGLIFEGQALAHDGSLIAVGGTLNSANTYTGDTTVTGIVTVNHSQAFGNSESPVFIHEDGHLRLYVEMDREFRIEGRLEVEQPGVTISQPIRLGGPISRPSEAQIEGVGVFEGSVELVPAAYSGPNIRGGEFNGAIVGSVHELSFIADDSITLAGTNNYSGLTRIYGDETVYANSSTAFGDTISGTHVTDATLELNATMNEPITVTSRGSVHVNAQQPRLPRLIEARQSSPPRTAVVAINHNGNYEENVDVVEGALEINANVTIADATVREGGKISVDDGAALHILSDQLDLYSGSLEGRIVGPSVIHKASGYEASLLDLPGYDGEIVVEQGRLRATPGDSLGTSGGATRVSGAYAALLIGVQETQSMNEDIFLENVHGDLTASALNIHRAVSFGGTPILDFYGSLDLGDLGSTIGNGRSDDIVILKLHGAVTGGNLTTQGRSFRAEIHSAQATFVGAADIRDGTLILTGQGQIHEASKIVLHEAPASTEGTLSIDQGDGTMLNDRIGDDIPVYFHGGRLGSRGELTETIGATTFMEGESTIEIDSATSDAEVKRITIESIERRIGATANVQMALNSNLFVNQSPPMSGGIFPWMYVRKTKSPGSSDEGFGLLTVNGIVPVTNFASDINSANTTSNVRLSQATTMTAASASINSLSVGHSSANLDLGGGELIVESGGIMFNSFGGISNGRLTAGAAGDYELILLTPSRVAADIIDNGANSVAVTGEGVLSGNNSYTGGTFAVEGGITFQTEASLPELTDVSTAGGEVRLEFTATRDKVLRNVSITEGGSLTGLQGNFAVSFEEMVLEEGDVLVRLTGDGAIHKRSPGVATITAPQGASYTGLVTIDAGKLNIRSLNSEASYLVRGGALGVNTTSADIELAGGDLIYGTGHSGVSNINIGSHVHVSADSRLVFDGGGNTNYDLVFSGELTGTGRLAISGVTIPLLSRFPVISFTNSSPNFTGSVTVDTLAVLLRKADALGDAPITVHSTGRLQLSAQDASDSTFFNPITLYDAELLGYASSNFEQKLAGSLHVLGDARITGVDLIGDAFLADGARLTVVDERFTQFRGAIYVGGEVELANGAYAIQSASDESTQVLGEIVSDAPEAILNLVDLGLDEMLFDFSIRAVEGQSLTLLKDGTPLSVEVSGLNKYVSGGGTIRNNVEVADGAVVAPGSSFGVLTIDGDLRLNPGSILSIEIGGYEAGLERDLLVVEQVLQVNDAVLEIELRRGFIPAADDVFAIAQASEISGRFLNGHNRIQFGSFAARIAYTDDLVLVQDFVRIPEPSSIALCGVLFFACGIMLIRTRKRERSWCWMH